MKYDTSFYAGQYAKICDHFELRQDKTSHEEMPYVIAAKTYLGKLDEAEILFEHQKENFSPDSISFCRFVLAIANSRLSKYKTARKYLVGNLVTQRQNPSHLTKYYSKVGLAGHRYFKGQFSKSLNDAHEAYELSLLINFAYGQCIAMDIKGQCLILTGKPRLGVKILQDALKNANKLGDGHIKNALSISIMRHSFQFGIETDITKIIDHIENIQVEDIYSKSSLLLELAKQYLLKGEKDLCKKTLDEICPLVYQSKNKRHQLQLNYLYAKVLYLENSMPMALTTVRNCLSQSIPDVERALLFDILYLEFKILTNINMLEELETKKRELIAIVEETGLGVAKRVLNRRKIASFDFTKGDDPLGDLLDELALKNSSNQYNLTKEIERKEYFGLFYKLTPVDPSRPCIYFDLIPGRMTLFYQGEVKHLIKGASFLLKKFIMSLYLGYSKKDQIVQYVWEQQYNPIVHQSLFHQTLHRIRTLFDGFKFLIQIEDQDYGLIEGAKVIDMGHLNTVTPITPSYQNPRDLDMNYRQIDLLNNLDQEESITVKSFVSKYNVAAITASRDLSYLWKKGHLLRIGKGRSTSYIRT